MRCKKHGADLSSTIGVCATCLRQRLIFIVEVQAQTQIPDPNPPPPLLFPRSVSPYVSRRKHDHIRFFSTPQVGPTFNDDGAGSYRKISKPRVSLLAWLFRSRSGKSSTDRDSQSSWMSAIFAGKGGRRKTSRCFTEAGSTIGAGSRHRGARGMSPDYSASGIGDSSSTPEWKRTPIQATPWRRRNGSSGLTLCLSPLVRASPNPKGMQGMEVGETTKPHLASAASFSMNRSRKLADFGRAISHR